MRWCIDDYDVHSEEKITGCQHKTFKSFNRWDGNAYFRGVCLVSPPPPRGSLVGDCH